MNDFDFERYKNLDASNARPARLNPTIKRLQDNLVEQSQLAEFFDNDVKEVIKQHNNPQDKARLNAVIRAMFATA